MTPPSHPPPPPPSLPTRVTRGSVTCVYCVDVRGCARRRTYTIENVNVRELLNSADALEQAMTRDLTGSERELLFNGMPAKCKRFGSVVVGKDTYRTKKVDDKKKTCQSWFRSVFDMEVRGTSITTERCDTLKMFVRASNHAWWRGPLCARHTSLSVLTQLGHYV